LGFYLELASALEALAGTNIRCLQLGSALAKFFSGGRELSEPPPADGPAVARRREIVTNLYDCLLRFPVSTIAVVEGYALGTGCVLASVCDIRVASETAMFGLPEVRAGSVGGARHLMRLLPHGVVWRMALTGEPITAQEAERHGLATVLPARNVWEEADRIARQIADFDPAMVCRVKRALWAAEDLTLADGVAVEWDYRRGPGERS
jgi:enoyl-CoA hydratase